MPAQDCIYIEKVPILSELSGYMLLHMLKVAGVKVKSQEELGLHWAERQRQSRESTTDDSGPWHECRKITASSEKNLLSHREQEQNETEGFYLWVFLL